MNYRDRCYKRYISAHWQYNRSLSRAEYDHLWRIFRLRFGKFLPNDKSVKIIDIACGSGHFLYFLQKEGYENAQGIDLSEEQLNVAKKMGLKNLQKADFFQYLPKHRRYFDMVAARDIIEHLKKDEVLRLLDIMYESLVVGGRILISTPNAQSLFGAGLVSIDFTHEHGFTPTSLAQVLRVCNFVDIKVYGERPIVYDLRSALRAGLWWQTRQILKLFRTIEYGTGRGMWRVHNIFEPTIFAVARKANG